MVTLTKAVTNTEIQIERDRQGRSFTKKHLQTNLYEKILKER